MSTTQKSKRQTPDWLVVRRPGSPVLFFITMLTILAIGWTEDNRSCLRQSPVRKQELVKEEVLHNFLISAANARYASSQHETGTQKEIDISASNEFQSQASRLKKVPTLQCYKILPDT